jgi:hypothetical protein
MQSQQQQQQQLFAVKRKVNGNANMYKNHGRLLPKMFILDMQHTAKFLTKQSGLREKREKEREKKGERL